MKIIKKEDKDYPKQLLQIKDPPEKLYIRGNEKLLNNKCIAIVGSRVCSEYGVKYAREFSKMLSQEGYTIISGLAIGIDTAAHDVAKNYRGSTIAVLGSGLNHVFPEENEVLFQEILDHSGCIISEYEPEQEINMKNFPKRNKIISGMAEAILVVEASGRSGSTITGRLGLEQKKTVYCLPRDIGVSKGVGTNELIQKGAKLVTKPEDILQDLKGTKEEKRMPKLENAKIQNVERNIPQEYMAIYQITSYTPQSIQYFAHKSGLKIAEVTQKLIMLELQGHIKSMPRKLLCKNIKGGNMYERHVVGDEGEEVATQYLLENNYQIIERNFSCRQGEIDIIAKEKNEIVFVEVKTRTNTQYGEPVEAVTYYKQKHIIKSIEYYLYIKKLENAFIRIDVIEVYYRGKNKYHVNHIKNAFES